MTSLGALPLDEAVPVLEGDPRLNDARTPTAHAHNDKADAAHNHDAAYAAPDHTHEAVGGIPAGVIVMWSGLLANIPSGWALCDGQNGTPDLRDRFIRGTAAGQNPGATGGALTHTHADHATHTHTYTQVPNHVHVQTVNSATTGGLSGYTPDTSSNTPAVSGYSTQNPTGGVATGTTNANAAQAHDSPSHLPPFYALAFLMKI